MENQKLASRLAVVIGVFIVALLSGYIYVTYLRSLETLRNTEFSAYALKALGIDAALTDINHGVRQYAETGNSAALDEMARGASELEKRIPEFAVLIEEPILQETRLSESFSGAQVSLEMAQVFLENPLPPNSPELRAFIGELYLYKSAYSMALQDLVDRELSIDALNQSNIQMQLRSSMQVSFVTLVLSVIGIAYFIRLSARNEALAEEMHHSAERVRRSSEIKTRLLAMLSHEVRTPMNGVIGLTSLVLADEKDREKAQLLTQVQKSASDMVNFLGEMLRFAGFSDQGNHRAHLTFTRDIKRELEKSLAPVAAAQGVDFEIECEGEIPDFIVIERNACQLGLFYLFSYILQHAPHKVFHPIMRVEYDRIAIKADFRFNSFYDGAWQIETITGETDDKDEEIHSDTLETTLSRSILQEIGGDVKIIRKQDDPEFQRVLIFLPISRADPDSIDIAYAGDLVDIQQKLSTTIYATKMQFYPLEEAARCRIAIIADASLGSRKLSKLRKEHPKLLLFGMTPAERGDLFDDFLDFSD